MVPINDSGPTKVPRTKRGFFNKVRTGCLTCKIRKVKCDEAKPHCQRCIKSGRKCDGYRARTSTPDSDPSLDPLVPWQPGALFASDAERRSFYYFQSHACKALGGHFNLSFWGREVMQAAIHYRPIRHLVVALGAAYESFQAGDGPGKGTPGMELALQQCNHSIKQLAAVPAQPSGTQSPETISCVLTASLLFIYLAMIRGHLAEAIQHVQSAIKLLHLLDNTPQKPATTTTPKYPIPPSQLRTLLTSIYGQLRAMINSTAPHHPNNPNKKITNNKNTHDTTDLLLTPTLPPPPQAYLSLPQAHASIESLFHNTLSFLQSSDLNPPTTPTALQALVTRHRELCAVLEGSQDALDVLANSLGKDGDSEERKGIAILRVYHLLMVVRLRIDVFRPEEREGAFDGVEGYLEEMLRLCEVVVGEGAENGEGKNGNGEGEGEGKMKKKKKVVCVSSGLGVVMPLHMIAARCRNGQVRRRAVELLVGCGRREGLWDAGLAGEVVRRTVEIEEGGCDGVEGWEEGDGRVREVKIELRGEREAVARFVRVGDWKRGLRGREEVIAW